MKDDNILKPKFEIAARTELHDRIDYYFEQIENSMSHYDLDEYPELLRSFQNLQDSILWWNQFWQDLE